MIQIPPLPQGFELNGDPEHDREEEVWAATHNVSTAPVGLRASYEAWRQSVGTIPAPDGWTLSAGWTVAGEPVLHLCSPTTEGPYTHPLHGDTGTVQIRQEAAAVWRDGALYRWDGEQRVEVAPEDLHSHAMEQRFNATSPKERAHMEALSEGRRRVRLWYTEGRLGSSHTQAREAGDWLDALLVWETMPRPLSDEERARRRQGLYYLHSVGLLDLAREHGITTTQEQP